MKDENGNNQLNGRPDEFGLPEGYFKKSADSVFNKIAWEEEHKEFVNLLRLKNVQGFTVPGHYFSEKERMLELIAYPKLDALKDQSAFKVPEAYFEKNDSFSLVEVENELQPFPALNAVRKQNNFSLDPAYFADNAAGLRTLLEKKKPARVISLFARRLGYAAAALLVAALGIWAYQFYFAPVEPEDCGTIACIDQQDLVKTKNLEGMEDEDLYRLVDPSALEKKLNTMPGENRNQGSRDDSLNDLPYEDLIDDI